MADLNDALRIIEARMREHERQANDPANVSAFRRRAQGRYGEAKAIYEAVRAIAGVEGMSNETAHAMAAEYQELMAHMDGGGDYFEFMAKRQHSDGVALPRLTEQQAYEQWANDPSHDMEPDKAFAAGIAYARGVKAVPFVPADAQLLGLMEGTGISESRPVGQQLDLLVAWARKCMTAWTDRARSQH